jgi:methionyl-tRNA formyltransferase
MNSVLLCVATEKGFEVLDAALSQAEQTRLHICTFKETKVARSFFGRINELATSRKLPLIRWGDFIRDPVNFLEREAIEGILCIGWRYLIPDEVVRWLDGNVVVAHDSLLPKLRGFAPLPTALITGEKTVGVTFIRAGRGVDDGDILWQQSIDISPRDSIADLIRRSIPLYRDGAERFLRGEFQEGTPQDETQATYSIWRDENDYRIDWSQDSHTIERTIRALGDPYLGAHCC